MEALKRKSNLKEVAVNKVGNARGLPLLWRKDVNVDLLSFSQNHVDALILFPSDSNKFRLKDRKLGGLFGIFTAKLNPRGLLAGILTKYFTARKKWVVTHKLKDRWTHSIAFSQNVL